MKATKFTGMKGAFLTAKTVKELKLVGRELTVKDVTDQEFDRDGKKQHKFVFDFDECDERLVLNATNKGIMIDAYGDETNDWIGQKVKLGVVKVNFKGQMQDSIQVLA